MKVAIVSTSDIEGGASIAAYRLHRGLLSANVESMMFVQLKKSNDLLVNDGFKKVYKLLAYLRPKLDQLILFFYPKRKTILFSSSVVPFGKMIERINAFNPDIVNIHWINGGAILLEDINKINSPIVWTLHDDWTYTGGCHVKWGCIKYQTGCNNCPQLGSKFTYDLSYINSFRKKRIFNKSRIIFHCISSWSYECARNSSLLKNKKIIRIPNVIDTKKFMPMDKKVCRAIWGIDNTSKVVLFGSMNPIGDSNKGFDKLKEIIRLHREKFLDNNIFYLIFGINDLILDFLPSNNYKCVGRIYDQVAMATLYNCADLFVIPSMQENLSNSILESMSCGVPVVGFDVGGSGDLVLNNLNGYLVKPYDEMSFAEKINQALSEDVNVRFSRNCRAHILEKFDSTKIINNYISEFYGIIKKTL